MMRDYRTNKYLGPVIQEFSDHLVMLSPGIDMFRHANMLRCLKDDQLHPNYEGHESIALQVFDKIKQQNNQYAN